MALMVTENPVFYDCEASSLNGFPIEIGWAQLDLRTGTVRSEGHLIRPPPDWDVHGKWDDQSEELHGISLAALNAHGRPPDEIARRMNETLPGCELFADSPFDETWLEQIFEAAWLDPAFTVRRTDAGVLIQQLVGDRAQYLAAKRRASRMSPRTHRAEGDARYWATVWTIIANGTRG